MPDWNQLGHNVASYIMDYEYTNALDALSIFESEYSRIKLIELLSKEIAYTRNSTKSNIYGFL